MNIESLCLQNDQRHENGTHSVPIYPSSTFTFDSAEQGMRQFKGEEPGYIYSRWNNPTTEALALKLEQLETFGLGIKSKAWVCSSGMGALSTLFLSTLKAGEKVLSHYSLYGGTEDLLQKVLPDLGIQHQIIDFKDLNRVEEVIKGDVSIKMVHLETPANPTLRCANIAAVAEIAHRHGRKVSVDNTFATPILQQPFAMGADFVIHSVTKYLNGHGSSIGGVLLGRDLDLMNTKVRSVYRLVGANGNPFESWLVINGIKTLPMRMERHCDNAQKVANFLENHPSIQQVNYLGLSSHPDHALAAQQMKSFGGMISFEVKGGIEAGKKFINKLQLCVRAVSLGTCDTLVSHPASMTHYGVEKSLREKYGITDGLIRMSVGIEYIDDILADMDQSLN